MTLLQRDDAALRVIEAGEGSPVIFQHGLGGDGQQAAQTFPSDAGWRRVTLECRGHGGSELGSARPFSFAMFADDVLAAADTAGADRFIAGGVSMGAAIALRLACRHPDRVTGLILVRPAWTFAAGPENMAPIAEAADLVLRLGRDEARRVFAKSPSAMRLAEDAPDNLASILGYFDRPDIESFARVLADIAADGPGPTPQEIAAIAVPALVIGNHHDHVHPLAMARALAAAIPGAVFAEAPPKALDAARHFACVHSAVGEFLKARRDNGSTT